MEGRESDGFCQGNVLCYPLVSVFPKLLSVAAVPEQMAKGFSRLITKRAGVFLFAEEVIGSYPSVEEHELKYS